jgi:hypothetical protein
MKGTLALSWGAYGGWYACRHRICLGWVALTLVPDVEIEDMMRAYIGARALKRRAASPPSPDERHEEFAKDNRRWNEKIDRALDEMDQLVPGTGAIHHRRMTGQRLIPGLRRQSFGGRAST